MYDLYKFALEEYEEEEENSKSKVIYAYFGLAIYKWQCLEQEFTNMLWIKKSFVDKIQSQDEFNKMVDEIEWRKFTMWKQIKELSKIYNLSDEIELELGEVLKMRNYLAHDYFKENIQKTCSKRWAEEILAYFTNFIAKANELDKKLTIYSEKYKQKLWLTKEKLKIIMRDLENKEKLRDI